MVANPLTRRTEFAAVPDTDKAWLDAALRAPETVAPDAVLAPKGDRGGALALLGGFAARVWSGSGAGSPPKGLAEGPGGGSIVGLLLPGDLSEPGGWLLGGLDHAVVALSACVVVRLALSVLEEAFGRPSLSAALTRVWLADKVLLRAGLVNIASRPAEQRIAHFLCETHARLEDSGRARADWFELPLSQTQIAGALGLTSDHVGRSLRALRAANLATVRRGVVTVPDAERLRRLAGFSRRGPTESV